MPVQRIKPYCLLLIFLSSIWVPVSGQDVESLSTPEMQAKTDSVTGQGEPEPGFVFKPVASISFGVIDFYGDVRNSLNGPSIGNYAAALNLSAHVDRNRYYIANFDVMMGKVGGNAYSHTDLEQNLNFESTLTSFGFSMEYRFGHLFAPDALVRPYVSLGIESIKFSAKGDLTDAGGLTYHYWSDGTIRDLREENTDPELSTILHRDYSYETDLRLREQQEFGLGDYSQYTIGFPVEAGFMFRIDPRTSFSVGVSYHYTLTDVMDNVGYSGTSVQGNKGMDSYLYTHVSFSFDLFKPAPGDPFYVEEWYDPLLIEDEDLDQVVDWYDRCPGTPEGVAVDTAGCPLDMDGDGIPDYQDLEADTRAGAWVDPDGTTVTEEEFLARMEIRNRAMKREEVAPYMDMILAAYITGTEVEIPDKFKPLDEDLDGYLSYEELLKAIDQYFDYQLDLSIAELRELNEFFFSQ